MDDPRIIVASPPLRVGEAADPLPVGIVRFSGPNPALGVVVKATFSFAEDAAEGAPVIAKLAAKQEPLSVNRMRAGEGGAEELAYASDFIPFKPLADVLLFGHAYGAPRPSSVSAAGEPTTVVEVSFGIEGAISRAVDVVCAGWAERVPLRSPHLRSAAGGGLDAAPVGPIANEHLLAQLAWHPPDFDYQVYNAATPEQRIDEIPVDATILLVGLSPRAPRRTVILPGLAPRVICELEGYERLAEVELFCDTLQIDTDREELVLLFRGEIPVTSLAATEVGTLLVAMLPRVAPDARDAPEALDPIDGALRELPRGHVFYALSPADFEPGAPAVPTTSSSLTMARYATWSSPQAPRPRLPLERYAAISAALAEQREPRAETLARHELDEDTWTLEERGWVEAIASGGMEGEGSLADRFGTLFVAEQDRLAAPEEARLTLADYARITVATERRDPTRVLAEERLTLAAWMRFDRRIGAAADQDEALAEELDRLLDEERERPFEPDPAELDDPADEDED